MKWCRVTLSKERADELARTVGLDLAYVEDEEDILLGEHVLLTFYKSNPTLSTEPEYESELLSFLTQKERDKVYLTRTPIKDGWRERRRREKEREEAREQERIAECKARGIDPDLRRPSINYPENGETWLECRDRWLVELAIYEQKLNEQIEAHEQKLHIERMEAMRRKGSQPLEQIDNDEWKEWKKKTSRSINDKDDTPKSRTYECQDCAARCMINWVVMNRAAKPKCQKCGSTRLELVAESAKKDQIRLYSERRANKIR